MTAMIMFLACIVVVTTAFKIQSKFSNRVDQQLQMNLFRQGKLITSSTAAVAGKLLSFFFFNSVSNLIRETQLDDVGLPKSRKFLTNAQLFGLVFDITGSSEVDVLRSFGVDGIGKIEGSSKLDGTGFATITTVHKDYVKKFVKTTELLPSQYKHFGNCDKKDNVENLELFIKNNPFFASALQSSKNFLGFTEYKIVTNTSDSFFGRLTSVLDDKLYNKITAQFDSNLKLSSITAVDRRTGNVINRRKDQLAGDLLFQLGYYFEVVHATIHYFHFLLTTAIDSATTRSKATGLRAWAAPYPVNVLIKTIEVDVLLFPDNGFLTGKVFKATSAAEVREIAKEMLSLWGTFKTADQFVSDFLLSSLKEDGGLSSFKRAGGLSEFFKHEALIGPYAKELSAAFEVVEAQGYKDTNFFLEEFLRNTGKDVCKIADIPTFIELMSVTGILHGSTLSGTRLMITPEIVARVNPDSDIYDGACTTLVRTLVGTIVGIVNDRYVFPSAIQKSSNLPPNVKAVLLKYDALTTDLKTRLVESLSKSPTRFINDGWVLTDHALDGLDTKQLTITTYI